MELPTPTTAKELERIATALQNPHLGFNARRMYLDTLDNILRQMRNEFEAELEETRRK